MGFRVMFSLFFFFFFFLILTIFKVFIEFVKVVLMFLCFGFFGFEACENLSSPTRDLTHTPCIRRQSLNHWAASEVPVL